MTCIVGYVDQKSHMVFLGGDSAATSTSDQQLLLVAPKVFQTGEGVIGCTTSIRMQQLLQYALDLPPCPETEDLERYLTTTFLDAIRTCFKEGGYSEKKNEQEQHEGTFLVGIRGRLFSIDGDYQVQEARCGYQAEGSGGDLALGALYALQQIEMAPEHRIRLALEAAAFHNSSVRAPFHIEGC